jgi:hypothetical protein
MATKGRVPGGDSQDPTGDLIRRGQAAVAIVARSADIPADRPWSHRPDAHQVELRFRRDQAAWRRRIHCARRLYAGVDDVAPDGRWTA